MALSKRLSRLLVSLWLLSLLFLPLVKADGLDDLANKALDKVYAILNDEASDGAKHETCGEEDLKVRREFGNLTEEERGGYIKAILCLQSKPSKIPKGAAPGAKNRYDDFVAVHINQTMGIHGTASFLSWHRYFIWAFEKALRDECGYTGFLPYVNWGKMPLNILDSPMFNAKTGMGGNGAYVPHNGFVAGTASVFVPPGNGGGCIKDGPFKNMTVNLGPVSVSTDVKIPMNPRPDGLGYNPRCIRRDVTNYFTRQYLRTQDFQNLITKPQTIGDFQTMMQIDKPTGFAVHSAGHFTIWGDPGGDLFVSPGDPAFFLHHGMIDRSWWIWQNQHPETRVQTVAGNTSFFGGPAGTLNDVIDLHVIAPANKMKDLMSTTAGPFCYIYE